jgi:hypothetical protein
MATHQGCGQCRPSITVVDRELSPEPGDALVDAKFGAGFTEGFLGASERALATARLALPRPTE